MRGELRSLRMHEQGEGGFSSWFIFFLEFPCAILGRCW